MQGQRVVSHVVRSSLAEAAAHGVRLKLRLSSSLSLSILFFWWTSYYQLLLTRLITTRNRYNVVLVVQESGDIPFTQVQSYLTSSQRNKYSNRTIAMAPSSAQRFSNLLSQAS
jgi:hypothetical protein